jgi:general secretion pathway protein N
MRRRYRWSLIAAGLVLGGVVAAPASLMDVGLARASGGQLRLAEASGSVWQGGGMLYYQGEREALPSSRLAWRFEPRALRSGELAWQVDSPGRQGRVALGVRGVRLEQLSLELPAEVIAEAAPAWHGAGLGGVLALQLESWRWQRGQFEGQLQLDWDGASANVSTVRPFGRYRLSVSGTGKGVGLNLATLAGPLTLQGDGHWQPGARLMLAGNASSTPEQAEGLRPLLLLLGRPSGENQYAWQLK